MSINKLTLHKYTIILHSTVLDTTKLFYFYTPIDLKQLIHLVSLEKNSVI